MGLLRGEAYGGAIHKLLLMKAKAGGRYWWKPRSPGEGLEASRAGKPGGEPVNDMCIFVCSASSPPPLVTVPNFQWEATCHVGFLLPFSKGGYQANELQFGDIYGTVGKEKLCIGTGRLEGCKSEVTGGHLATKGEMNTS